MSLVARISLVISVLCITFHLTAAASIMNRPQRNDISTVADALKYLQELDNYYSQIARPRIVTRSSNASSDTGSSALDAMPLQERQMIETAIQLMRLRTIDRLYAKHSRPRFGKRDDTPSSGLKFLSTDEGSKFEFDPEEVNWNAKLFNRR